METKARQIISRYPEMPKYVKLAETFRLQIEAGELAPGQRLPSFVELRDQLGIGQSTLERAYTLLEEESLIVREPGRGIFVAPPRRRSRTGTIGLLGVTPEKAEHPYYARLLSGVQNTAYNSGFEVLLLNDKLPIRPERLDGLVIYSHRPELVLERLPNDLPRVAVLFPTPLAPSVVADDFGGAYAATQHLISLGHRRIAYLASPSNEVIYSQRLKGHYSALREAGIEPQARWIKPLEEAENDLTPSYVSLLVRGRKQMKEWMEGGFRDLKCTALLAHNDDVAMGVLQALTEAQVSVPSELSLVGFDDAHYSQMVSPALTTVHVPLAQIGARAMELMETQIEGQASESRSDYPLERLETPLVPRDSTAPPQ